MNLNQLKKEIEQIKLSLLEGDNACCCQYIEKFAGVEPSPEALAIIQANLKCRLHDRKHVGYSYVEVCSSIANEDDLLIN